MKVTELLSEMAKRASPEQFSAMAIKKYGKDKSKSLTMAEVQAVAKENDVQVPGYIIKQKVARARFNAVYGDAKEPAKEPEKKAEPKLSDRGDVKASARMAADAFAKSKPAEKKSDVDAWKAIATDDYQKRDGKYPKSDVPDTIDVYTSHNLSAMFAFKNTSEKTATAWVKLFLDRKGLKYKKLGVRQAGDYHDDWVEVFVNVE